MTLHEAIKTVLQKNGRPMTAKDIASEINLHDYYTRTDKEPIQRSQVFARIKNYPSIFQDINGHIVLVEDNTWRNLLTSYWSLVNIIRGIYIVADMQFIIAVLLYYKRLVDKSLLAFKNWQINDGQLIIAELRLLEASHIAPVGVFEECSRLMDKLDDHKKIEIWSELKRIHTESLDDKEFGNIYEYLLTLDALDGYKSSINHTPYSLRQLMVELLNPENGRSIYDPVAGIGGLLIESLLFSRSENLLAKGSEINERIAQLGNMNLFMHGIHNVKIEAGDCFEQINVKQSYDYIIGDLPAKGITNSRAHAILFSRYKLSAPKSGVSFGSIVLLVLEKLNSHGKAVLAVSDGFLIKKGKEKEIRDLLVARDLVQSIISLPYGTLRPYTDAKASLLVLNKNKPDYSKGKIQFISGKVENQNAKSLILDIDEIRQAFASKEIISRSAQVIAISDLRPDTNLSAEAYDFEFLLGATMEREGKGKLLSELVEIRAGTSPEKSDIHRDGDVPMVKVESLSKDILDLNLRLQTSDHVISENRYARAIVSQECVLIARIGDNLKPTIYKPNKDLPQIFLHSNVYALIPKKGGEINIEYLYYQLHSAFIQEQIGKRRLGAVMPYVSISGLKQIVVPYTKIGAQIDFVDLQKANLIAEERNRTEERIKALGYKEKTKQAESDILKTLTHQLRPTFLGLNNVTNRIDRIVQREHLGNLKEYQEADVKKISDPEIAAFIAKPDNFTIRQLLDKLASESRHISDILTNVDKVMNFKLSAEDFKEVDVLEFIQNYKREKEIDNSLQNMITVEGEPTIVLINEASFRELLDQLFLNAEKHAFQEENVQKIKKIQFVIKYDRQREVAAIEYSNNGAPYELTQKDFITAFEKGNKSKGSGIGGNYINRIVEAHKGILSVAENYKKGFLLTIELPTANIHEL